MISKESLKNAILDSSALVFQKFVLLANDKNKNHMFCFYEGKDAPYYSVRVKNKFGDKYHNFKCGNKSKVIRIYGRVKQYKSKFNLAFFVDKDFDDNINNQDFYETCTYSIENFYVYDECLIDILKNEFSLNTSDSQYSEILDLFKFKREEYCNLIHLFNSWYFALKEKKKKLNLETTNVSLDDKLPNDFLNLDIENLSGNYDLSKIKKKYKCAIDVTDEEVALASLELKKDVNYKILRGKFLMTFMIKFLEYLVTDSKSNKKLVKENVNFHTDKVIALSHLSNYAYTPDCLTNYLTYFERNIA